MLVVIQALAVVAVAIPSFVPVGPMVLAFVEVIVGIVRGGGDLARMRSRAILSLVPVAALACVGMVVVIRALAVVAVAIPSFVPVGPMVLVFVEVIVGVVRGGGDLARMLSRAILSVVRVAALACLGMVVARQALVIVAGAIPSFVPVGPMVLVFVEVIVGIVGGGGDLARMLSRAILSVVRVAALACVGMVVARQALLIGAGTVSGFVRVGLVVLAFIGIVVD